MQPLPRHSATESTAATPRSDLWLVSLARLPILGFP
jgi:hypothetical protein